MHRYIVDSEGQLNSFGLLSTTPGDVYSKCRTIFPKVTRSASRLSPSECVL